MWMIVAGPEVVGSFASEDNAREWAEAYIGDTPGQWYVANFTEARSYEREVEPSSPESPWLSAS
jgi:hypothetical protein